MIDATALKNGKTFSMDGKPYYVLKYTHQKIGRGGASVKLSVRNLESGKLEEKTLNSNVKVEEIAISKKAMQYLFKDSAGVTFMDSQTYEQTQIPLQLIKEQLSFIKEGEMVNILFWGEKALSVELPPKVVLTVIDTAPGAKGNSATNIYKPAVLENNLNTKVPPFIKVGDKVRVDTKTGEYVERVK